MKKAFTLTCFAVLYFAAANLYAQEKGRLQETGAPAPSTADLKKQMEGVVAPSSKLYPANFERSAPFDKLYQADGPYSYANRNAEILDKRNATTRHYLNKDNTITAVSTAGESHYMEDGLWHTILNDIYSDNTFSGFGHAAVYNRFKTYYGDNLGGNGIKLVTEQGIQISMMQDAKVLYLNNDMQVLGTAAQLEGSVKSVNNEVINYQNLFAGVDATVKQSAIGYELDYELNNNQWFNAPTDAAYVAFCEGIKVPAGYHAVLDNDGSNVLILGADNKTLLKYKAPVFYDKNDEFNNDTRIKGRYFVKEENGLVYVYVLVPVEWLQANKDKQLVIDPVVVVTPPVAQFWTFTVDNDGGCDYSTDNDADENMRVGFDDGNVDNDFYQCYASFDLSGVPNDACVLSASQYWYQWRFQNPRNDDNSCEFYFQAYDPISTNPAGVPTCDQIQNEINATFTVYSRWNVWNNCSGACFDYNESNGWKDWNAVNVGPRVAAALPYDFVAFSLYRSSGHSDPFFDNNDEWLDYSGYASGNRPQIHITYQQPYYAASSISSNVGTSICNGASVTLSRVGGTTGTDGNWVFRSGSCGGTFVANGSTVTVSPTTTTTYYLRGEGSCGNTGCVSITINVTPDPTVSLSGSTTICNGGSTVLTASPSNGLSCSAVTWESGPSSLGPWGGIPGTGNTLTVSPASTTFYRAVYACGGTGCNPNPAYSNAVSVTVQTLSSPPTSITGTTAICSGTSTVLTANGATVGTGGVYRWYTGSCGGTLVGTGPSITVSPTSTIAYYVRVEGTCNITTCATITVTVYNLSTAATSVSGSPAICIGGSTTLSVVGGQLGYLAGWEWYNGACGGTVIGTGPAITVSPSSTTTYYVRAVGNCNTTICRSFTVNVNPLPNGNISGTGTICFGGSTALTLNVTTGTGPFNIVYTDGTNVFTRNGVSSGDTIMVAPGTNTTYQYTQITDANGCVRTLGFLGGATVTVAPLPVINSAPATAVLCFGGNTGTITVNATNGTPGYNYSNDGGITYQASNVFSGLTAGPYTIYVRDAQGCISAPSVVNVTQPTVLDHTTAITDASCASVFDGAITVSATGGTGVYSYSLNGGPSQSGNTFNGLAGNTYVVQVSDANGCTDTSHVVVNNTYGVTGSIVSQTDVSCFGGTDGTVTVQLSGGIPAYSYSINGITFVPTSTFTGLASGNYTIIARDSKGCNDAIPVTINQPNLLQAIVDSVSNILCNGGGTGGVYISVTGGTGPYSYLWNTGATTQDITGIGAGIYNVAITDSKGCSTSAGVTITQPLPLFVTVASFYNLNCNNDSSGAIDITVNGGIPPYSFAWSNTATTEDIYGLQAGTYAATVTDANGCIANISQAITQPALLTSSVTSNNVNCNGAANGSIDLTVNGGTPAYSYLWSNGATTQDLNAIAGGNYSVVVYDSKGCSVTNAVVITEPAPIALTAVVTNVLCNGATTGDINLSVNGGAPAYTFNWSNGANSEDISNLAAGTYTVNLIDANGCTASANFTVTQPAGLVLNATPVNVACAGGANGSIDITVNGGVFPYAFAWSNTATTEDINGLSGGLYSVVVTDANGCTVSQSFNIAEPLAITSSVVATNIVCNGTNTGAADLTVSNGTAPYTYFWSNFQTSQDITGLGAGTYYVVITDANGCIKNDSVVITQPAPIAISANLTNVLCNGASTGAIDITLTGGTPAFTFVWSNGATTEDVTGLAAGTYSVTATDVNGCIVTAAYTLTQPLAMVLASTVTDVNCAGGASGTIDVTIYGGVFPYTFAWTNGATTEDVSSLSGGPYSVTVTDANGCALSQSFNVNEPLAITSTVVVTNVLCNGDASGAADLTVSGGIAPYTFLWSNFQASEDVSGLNGGLYYVIITDANGCTHRDSALIAEPAALVLSTVISNISCFNSNDGAIDLTVTGGTTPYSYAWSNGAITQDLSLLQSGTYAVTVTDGNGCTATTTVVIINPSVITANFIVNDPSCFGSTDGAIDLIPSGGTPPFTYAWSNSATTEDITAIGGGTYMITITDTKGCSRVDSATAVEPLPLVTSGFIKNVSCFGAADGFIDITAYGGTLPYAFNWSSSQSTEDIGGLVGGNYFVTVTDANGCQASTLYPVLEPIQLSVNVVGANVSCFGANDAHVAAVPAGGTTPYNYLWTTFDIDSAVYGLGAGKYTVQVVDSNGCMTYDSLTVTEPSQIVIAGMVTDAVCFGGSNGAVDITVTGGAPAYTFTWSNSASTEDISAVPAAVYTVVVTDASNCSNTASFTVGQGEEITLDVASLNPVCNGGNTGSATALVDGGDAPYTYAWSTGATSVSIGLLVAGSYDVTVTDSKACTVAQNVQIAAPADLVVDATAQGSKCFNQASGEVTTVVTGGFPPYTYLLNGSGQNSGSFSGLLPGDYVLLVTDANGCQGTDTFRVTSPTEITVDLNVTQQVILTGMETQLVANSSSVTPIIAHYWSPDTVIVDCDSTQNCSTPFAKPRTTTIFTVTVMNSDSCTASDTVTVYVQNELSAFMPTAITPNGDGLNDRFEFDILGAEKIEVSIFNRWGARVFYNAAQSNGITGTEGWDGTADGKPLAQDTYVYTLRVTYFDNEPKDYTGTVTIMK